MDHFVFLHAQVMSRVHFSGKKIFFFFFGNLGLAVL